MEEHLIRASKAKIKAISKLPLALPNISNDFKDAHLKMSTFAVSNDQLRLCGTVCKNMWILQVSVYVREGDGAIKSAKYVQELLDGMPYSSDLEYKDTIFHIAKKGDPSPALVKDGWYIVPVSFRIVIYK